MKKNIFNFNSKKIFIIGGSGFLGLEISNLLSELGAEVFCLDIKKDKRLNKKVKFLRFDVSRKELTKKFKIFLNDFGVPHSFINCSYPTTKSYSKAKFEKVKLQTIKENVNIHLNSYVWMARLVAEEMRKKKIKGNIIQFGSHYGVIGQDTEIYKGTNMSENMIYSAIKGGIISNTKQLAVHYGKWGIRANCVCPGGVEGHIKNKKIKQSRLFVKNYSKRTPLNRLAKKEEIAPAVAFLASDSASYITGITLMIDGGWTAS